MHFAVCGLHLSGGPLNHQIVSAGGKLIRSTRTSPNYTMHAVSSVTSPLKPALVYHPGGGQGTSAIDVEVWNIPEESIGGLLKTVPPPLGFGTVWLENEETVYGFVAEGWAADSKLCDAVGLESMNITSFGGWRNFMKSKSATK